MTDDVIELVIKIPKEQYSLIMQSHRDGVARFVDKEGMMYAIKTGTPLKKGHGKLVDVNSIPEEDRGITVKSLLHPGTIAVAGAINLEEYVNGLPTIIEADAPKKRKGTPLEENDSGYNCENWIP